MKKNQNYKSIILWLSTALLTVFIMIFVGGITRLTDSGLSMVEWRPMMGTIPPLTQADWEIAFSKYKQFPEYQKINSNMVLKEFKWIFFWEYFHRMIGRFLGLLFIFPYIIFKLKNKIPNIIHSRLILLFLLGAFQAVIGWYMVKSGLIDRPDVSHYRLALHLSVALIIYSLILWLLLTTQQLNKKTPIINLNSQIKNRLKLKKHSIAIIVLISAQILYGVLMAGLKGGLGFNTWPKMGAEWLPVEIFNRTPFLLNFLESTYVLQFMHRWLGVLVALSCIVFSIKILKSNSPLSPHHKPYLNLKYAAFCLILMVSMQFILGVGSLVMMVPISVASLHQIGAIILLSISLYITFILNNEKIHI